MASKKYLKDYTLTPEVNAKGRLRPVASYAGDYFRFTAWSGDVRAARQRYLLLGIPAGVILFLLLYFSGVFDWNHRWLVLPIAFNVIPAFGTGMGIGRFCTAPEKMTRKLRDKICDRLPPFSLFLMIFSFLSLASAVTLLILTGITVPAGLYALGTLILLVLSVLIFAQRKILATETVKS